MPAKEQIADSFYLFRHALRCSVVQLCCVHRHQNPIDSAHHPKHNRHVLFAQRKKQLFCHWKTTAITEWDTTILRPCRMKSRRIWLTQIKENIFFCGKRWHSSCYHPESGKKNSGDICKRVTRKCVKTSNLLHGSQINSSEDESERDTLSGIEWW